MQVPMKLTLDAYFHDSKMCFANITHRVHPTKILKTSPSNGHQFRHDFNSENWKWTNFGIECLGGS